MNREIRSSLCLSLLPAGATLERPSPPPPPPPTSLIVDPQPSLGRRRLSQLGFFVAAAAPTCSPVVARLTPRRLVTGGRNKRDDNNNNNKCQPQDRPFPHPKVAMAAPRQTLEADPRHSLPATGGAPLAARRPSADLCGTRAKRVFSLIRADVSVGRNSLSRLFAHGAARCAAAAAAT